MRRGTTTCSRSSFDGMLPDPPLPTVRRFDHGLAKRSANGLYRDRVALMNSMLRSAKDEVAIEDEIVSEQCRRRRSSSIAVRLNNPSRRRVEEVFVMTSERMCRPDPCLDLTEVTAA